MTQCVFCGKERPDYEGVHLIKNDGTISYYCSSKCRKNSIKLGRDKRKIRWTNAYRIVRSQESHKHEEKSSEKNKPAKSDLKKDAKIA